MKLYFLSILVASLSLASAESLTGTVMDPQGRGVPGAKINAFSRVGGVSESTTSDSSGSYRFDGLPAGDYLLRAEANGFSPFLAEEVRVNAGSRLDISLQLAGARDEVVVTASGTPQAPGEVSKSITVIDRAEADDRNVEALSDVVNLAPGVRIEQLGGAGAFTSIHIRGMRAQDTAVLVDGLRLRDASATQGDASGLIEDLLSAGTSRVEVLNGSGSSLYGTNAIGGVVNVITDEGGGRTRGSLLLDGGSLGASRARAQIAGGAHDGRIDYSLGVTQVYVADGVGGDLPFRDTNAQGRIAFHLAPWASLTARLFAGNSFTKVPGEPAAIGSPSGNGIIDAVPFSTFLPAPDDPDSTRAARFISGALILAGQPAPTFDYSISFQTLENSRRYGDGPAGLGYQPLGSTRSLYDGRIQTMNAHVGYRLGSHNLLTTGYEFENENYANDSKDFTNPAAASGTNVTELSHSYFAQDQLRLFGDRLQFSGAFRAQFFGLDTPAFTPSVFAPFQGIAFASPPPAYTGDGSAAYFFRKTSTKLRAHVGRGYRAPSLFERFGTGFDPVYGYTVYGDPRLKPEHSIGLDAGVDQSFAHGRVKASASYFYTWLQNVIAFGAAGDSFGYFNTQGGISRGVELSTAISPIRSLSLTAAYTFVNAQERAPIVSDILQTFAIPRNQFTFLATERFTSRLMFTLDTLDSSSYVAPIYGSTGSQVFRFNGMKRLNLGASYRLPVKEFAAIRFFIRANNVLDQAYFESGFPTPGRTVTAGIQFEF